MIEEVPELAKYGQTGIIMVLISVVGVVIIKLFEVSKGYQRILDEHLKRLTNAFEDNSLIVKQNTDAMKEFKDTIKDCHYNHK